MASSINERLKRFLEELTTDPVEERVVEYVIREVHNGRTLMEVMKDPYVRNRLNEEERDELLQKTEVIDALESEIRSVFRAPDIGYSS